MGGKVHAFFLPKSYISQSCTNLYARTEVTPSCKGNGALGCDSEQPGCPAKNCITVGEGQALPQQSSGIGILVESFLSSPRPPVPYPGDVLLPSPDTGSVTR